MLSTDPDSVDFYQSRISFFVDRYQRVEINSTFESKLRRRWCGNFYFERVPYVSFSHASAGSAHHRRQLLGEVSDGRLRREHLLRRTRQPLFPSQAPGGRRCRAVILGNGGVRRHPYRFCARGIRWLTLFCIGFTSKTRLTGRVRVHEVSAFLFRRVHPSLEDVISFRSTARSLHAPV